MNLKPIEYRILYNNRNITKDISDYMLSLTYTDKHAGESDEVQLELHDKDLVWQNEWYPDKGAKITVQIIDGDAVLDCGTFTVDENEYTMSRSGGEVFSIRGLAAAITKAIRTKSNTAHENKTLRELCNTVAAKHSLKVVGTIADIRISRITQHQETDLAFLHRISEKYGYTFSIRGDQLIFTSLFELATRRHVLSIDKTELTDFKFTVKSKKVSKKVTVSYHNPSQNAVVGASVEKGDVQKEMATSFNSQVEEADKIPAPDLTEEETEPADDDNDVEPVDNELQAEIVGKSKMVHSIMHESEISGSLPGNPLIITGNQIEITGVGRFSGIYYVIESAHQLDRGTGYVTGFKANKTGRVDSKKHKPKKKAKATDDNLPVEGPDYAEGATEE